MSGFLTRLRDFDAYTKPLDDFRVKTLTGGAVTVLAGITIIILAISETTSFLRTDVAEQLFVDSTTSDQRVHVNFDITFQKLPCPFVTVDVMDVSSDNQDNIQDDIYKVRVDQHGNNMTAPNKIEVNQNKTGEVALAPTTPKCGSCYGALPDGSCCNTCEEVKDAYHIRGWQMDAQTVEQCKNDPWVKILLEYKDEGCRVYGKVQVAKVAGNFHLAPGDPHRTMRAHVHDLHSMDPTKFDCSHTIHHLSFGTHYPGKSYPLDQKHFESAKGGIMYQYYVKVVPTSYVHLNGNTEASHQFSVTTHPKQLGQGVAGLPGVFVQYEFSPLMVRYEERRQSLSEWLVSLCAIVGGVFTVASLIDSFIYSTQRVIEKKMQINKLG
ncbi:unnamed protein product, partial [Mesorhabditis belari]|uniref:Endoplasmic reticulum-Golgi intermediate compartment protein 3 n=1 Tax=Mesorhabditis belari TaxID=2138241 RepID=A0AAF3JB75_9BILA